MFSRAILNFNLFRRTFAPDVNTVHVVSLSCNPVPPERYGGIELVVAHLCEGLAKLGIKVVCYSPGPLRVEGVAHCRTLDAPTLHVKDGGVPNTPEHLAAVAAQLREKLIPGDVVVLNHPDHFSYLKRSLGVARLLRTFFCEVAHWTYVSMPQNVVYPSKALQNAVNRAGACIPHGEKLLFAEPRTQAEDHLFFAGRITRDKGVDIALAACEKLGINLVLAGPLNDKEFAAQILAHPSVRYLGELTYEELFSQYRKAAALVYMTQYVEPFGLSVIEAMAAGAPVITTGKGGTGETVVSGSTGFFCQSADEIVEAYGRLKSLSSEACIARARHYTVEAMARRYLVFFSDRMNQPNAEA